jgi:predicted flap endonuclease-1-like 5' DNA nuclease
MAAGKREILELLRELAQLTLLDEENPQSFRVRAYESAEHAINAQTADLSALSLKELQQIEGIGKSTAEKIRELIDTGRVQRLEELRQKHPASVAALLRIQGLGPKMLGRLRNELGVQSLADLRRVLAEHRLRGLKGFGEKSAIAAVAVRELIYDAEGNIVKSPADRRRRPGLEPVAAAAELEPGQTRKETEGVFVVRDGKVEFVPIQMGIAGDTYFEVVSGLKAGDEVVTGPYASVRSIGDGTAVQVERPAPASRR